MKTEQQIRDKYKEMLQYTEILDDKVQNPNKYKDITTENIQQHIKAREEQYQLNSLIEWILN
jgi:hypothetical protein